MRVPQEPVEVHAQITKPTSFSLLRGLILCNNKGIYNIGEYYYY